MSFSQLPLIEIDTPLPAKTLIDAEWLTTQIDAVVERQKAHRQAASILNAARRKAEKVMRDVYRSQHKMETEMADEMERLREATIEHSESQWLATHVKYLLEGEEMQQAWVDKVAKHIHHSIEKVLTAWFDEQPYDQTLCHRLTKQVQNMGKEGNLTLRVHQQHLEKMRETFGERLTLVADPSFTVDQAELSSLLLSVEFSLSLHFKQLLSWLRQSESLPGGSYGAQNQ